MLPIIGPILDIINKFVPDAKAQADLRINLEQELTKQMGLQASIINKEQESASWLARNIRPLCFGMFMVMTAIYFCMYTIMPFIIVFFDMNRYMPQDPGMNESLVGIIEICLGGYIGGRSAEKVARIIRK